MSESDRNQNHKRGKPLLGLIAWAFTPCAVANLEPHIAELFPPAALKAARRLELGEASIPSTGAR